MKKILLVLLAASLGLPALAASPPKAGDWSAYGHDAGGGRFSPLAQIRPENVTSLQVAWTYHMNPEPEKKAGFVPFSTTTPLVVDGRMFLGTPYGRVVALDPTDGKELWAYGLADGDQPAFRGVGYWPGDAKHAPRLIVATQRGRIIALDAKTGAPSKGFGQGGVVDSKTPEIMNGFPNASYGYSAPPVIYKNLAILGSKVQEAPSKGPSGDARAWDVITGKLVWTFHSIPRPGEKFHETWDGDSWRQRSGVNLWNLPTVDAERGVAYLPFSSPAFDRYGGDHKGSNLFANSLVAVDAKTGKYLWHFQTVHHDIWDNDLHTPPTLLTVKKDGKTIPAIAVMNKTTLLFLLDRVTGKPIFGVTERPVPPSLVAGEEAWPTQPFPNKPGILTRMSFDLDEVADITPEHHAVCQALIDKDGAVGAKMFQPLRDDRPAIRFPGATGGPEWGGGAFDPKRGLFIFNINQIGTMEKLVKGKNGEWNVISARFLDPKTKSPCHKPPWGELVAVDVNTGEVAWRSTLGVTDAFPPGKQDTGRPANAGPIVTAGGLTFMGGTDDHRFRAFDTGSGKELWTYSLDYSAHATPMSYLGKDGRQYVAIVATGGSYLNSPGGGDSLLVFALPK
ncbi:MAG: quinoprotein glucose dehydrogenase [Caulobacter sp.]|nr:quinoprotein glucose dehydrogenase [Caulobacter sp.]